MLTVDKYMNNNTSGYLGSRIYIYKTSSENRPWSVSRGEKKSTQSTDVVKSIDGVRSKMGLDLARYLNVGDYSCPVKINICAWRKRPESY